uniref:Uncharacterized protein n=1 Tax=Arundo donax TaxID=35708 RepID=A0A0A9DZT8_ARUDO
MLVKVLCSACEVTEASVTPHLARTAAAASTPRTASRGSISACPSSTPAALPLPPPPCHRPCATYASSGMRHLLFLPRGPRAALPELQRCRAHSQRLRLHASSLPSHRHQGRRGAGRPILVVARAVASPPRRRRATWRRSTARATSAWQSPRRRPLSSPGGSPSGPP